MGAKAKGLDATIARLRAKAERARDITPALTVAAEAVKTAIDDRFRSSTDFAGAAFAKNAPSTIKKKGSSKPLIDSGVTRASTSARVVSGTTIRFGTNQPAAGYGWFGTRRAPERNPMPVDKTGAWRIGARLADQLRAKVSRIVVRYITTGRLSAG